MKTKCLLIFPFFTLSLLCGCNSSGATSSVPIYKGMVISRQPSNSSMLAYYKDGDNGNHYGHDKHDDEIEESVDEIVNIDVVTDDEVKYYVNPLEVFIVEVVVSNPSQFEIQSFTLNGKKYANYMFEEGSDMEHLYLKVTAPEASGYYDYTIDAIKYIDGVDIKDVDMSQGNKSIKAGICYTSAPTAEVVSASVSTTEAELKITISDPQALIKTNELSIYLTNGTEVLSSKPLVVGENQIKFDNLKMTTKYEFGVAAIYDFVDGEDLSVHWLIKNSFETLGAFSFVDVKEEKTSISFDFKKEGDSGSIKSVSIYDTETEELIETKEAPVEGFDNLLSNHNYTLVADFSYMSGDSEINDWIKLDVTTDAYLAPLFDLRDISVYDTSFSARLNINDKDSIMSSFVSKLYKGGSIVATSESENVAFNNLDPYSQYRLVVEYSYNLNDGNGVINGTYEHAFKTSPTIEFRNCIISNTSAISEGDVIYFQININNPHNAKVVSVVIDGKSYPVDSSSTPTKVFASIVSSGQFEGGETQLTITELTAELDGVSYKVHISENNSDSVFINGRLKVNRFYLADSTMKERKFEYISADEKVYLGLELSNKTGYNIDQLEAFINARNKNGYVNVDQNIDDSTMVKVDDAHILFDFPDILSMYASANSFVVEVNVKSVAYSNETYSNLLTLSMKQSFTFVESGVAVEVSSKDDMLNIDYDRSCIYSLQNDINLAGVEWNGVEMTGVFLGNNHSIKNMSFISTIRERDVNIGVFSKARGVIKDLNIVNSTIMFTGVNESGSRPRGDIGFLCAKNDGSLIIENCSVDQDSLISVKGDFEEVMIGGFMSSVNEGSVIKNCFNRGYIFNEGISGYVGGICGYAFRNAVITDCENYGNVNGTSRVGGIAGKLDCVTLNKCVNKGEVVGENDIGGIAGESYNSDVSDCENSGNISGINGVSGVTGALNSGNVINCSNSGNVSGKFSTSGIVGNMYNASKILDCVNEGNVKGNNDTGGIFGDGSTSSSTVVDNCINKGTIEGFYSAGGIGCLGGGTISNCINYGDVSGETQIAGILGNAGTAKILKCINYGNVSGKRNIAGIIGNSNACDTEGCTNYGYVEGEYEVAGIVGGTCNNSTVTDCINKGTIKGNGSVDGICPIAEGITVTECVNEGTIIDGGQDVPEDPEDVDEPEEIEE